MENVRISVSDFVALTNQTLEYAYPTVAIEGEVASFKVNQGKYVFFDLKDAGATVGCFMTVWQLKTPIEDGMKVIVEASPKLTQWGKFSLTVRLVRPLGEGALKKSFELLRAKLEKEGLFALDRKRSLPQMPQRIGVISSTQAAGYADFIKILDDRWGGVRVEVAHVQVQGQVAADQIIRALTYFNEQEEPPEVIVVLRGGGSADDLAVFNEEPLVRAIATSRTPVMTGIGHEVDESLADMAADVRAATPSNAAQLLVPDRHDVARSVHANVRRALTRLEAVLDHTKQAVTTQADAVFMRIMASEESLRQELAYLRRTAEQLDPYHILAKGYAVVRGKRSVGEVLTIEEQHAIITAKVEAYEER